mgnify:CR=1 FL=1
MPGARRKLVLVDGLGLSDFAPAPEFGRALMAFVEGPSEETHDQLWRKCAFDLDRLQQRMGDEWHNLKAYNLDRANDRSLGPAQQTLMGSFGIPSIPDQELARIPTPTSLIWGRYDLAAPLLVAQRAAERYGWQLQVIENAADDPAMEQPEAFVEALRGAFGQDGRVLVGEHRLDVDALDDLAG